MRLAHISILSLFLVIITSYACKRNEQGSDLQKNALKEVLVKYDTKTVQLPDGWNLSPVGTNIPLGDLPLNLAVSANQKWMTVMNNGQSGHDIQLIDIQKEQVVDTLAVKRAWLGLIFAEGDSILFASGGHENLIWQLKRNGNQLSIKDSIVLGRPWPDQKIHPSGIAWDHKDEVLYAVTKEDSSLYVIDWKNKSVDYILPLGAEAYTCKLNPDPLRKELYISIWGGKKVSVIDLEKKAIKTEISTGSHPNDMILTKDGKTLFVTTANDNGVSVVELDGYKVVSNLNTALYPNAPKGSTPNALCLSEDEKLLFVANANNNCLAVFELEKEGEIEPMGFIPTGWYPTAVKSIGSKIWVANGKGIASAANPNGPNPYSRKRNEEYIGGMFKGSMSVIEIPEEKELSDYTMMVYGNTPYDKEAELIPGSLKDNPVPSKVGDPSPIKYVFYVVKENRTYDQVFGDIPGANGDPSLCLFPDSVTPNQHALAKEFVLLDNFYVNAEVSADGHNWSMGAYATDYIEKIWPTGYGGRGGNYDYEGTREIAYPDEGYIWDYCKMEGISYRSYGIFTDKDTTKYPALIGHASPIYPGYDLTIKDSLRVELWKHEFDSLLAINAVPQFNSIRFGNDHTAGARLGMPTPAAMVADNDLAVGKLVEYISNSPIWNESAIFILEDDAQNGPDHVDAHRSISMVVSPYTRIQKTVSELYTTCSVLRTMELILGLPPMSQYDAAATPMWACFQTSPNLSPYMAHPSNIDLNELNVEQNALSDQSAGINLRLEDSEPDIAFNEVIWKTVRGIEAEMPAPRRGAFLKELESEDQD